VDVSLATNVIDLPRLARTLPALAASPVKDARVKVAARVQGDLADAASQTVNVSSLDFTGGGSRLTGSLRLRNPTNPDIAFDLSSPRLDLDKLLPAEEKGGGERKAAEGAKPAEGAGGGGGVVVPEIVKTMRAGGILKIVEGVFKGFPFRDFRGELSLQGGKLEFKTLRFGTYGGTVDAAGTRVDLAQPRPPFAVKVRLAGIDAGALLSSQTSLGRTVSGVLGADLDLSGAGTAWEDIARTLSGALGGEIVRGQIQGLNLVGATAKPLAGALPFAGKALGIDLDEYSQTAFDSLAGQFSVKDGALRTTKPIRIGTGGNGDAELSGNIGLDKKLDLTGTYALSPGLIETLTAGKVKPAAPVPVGVQIGGEMTKPRIAKVLVADAAKQLIAEEAKKQAGKVVEKAKDEVKKEAEKKGKSLLKKLFK
jgi:hypothetical protein